MHEAITLDTGELTPEQMNQILKTLPVELTFVDETDTVRYFTGVPDKIFPRGKGSLGTRVQGCHPKKSLHLVEQIIEAFRAGRADTAEFWIEMKGRFVYIQYFAVRDDDGTYKGVLEAVQDATHIRELKGEQRLLDLKLE
ncbi:hypothetical protein GF324_01780 [bacterium]|nr:hypothetical protein [bacterium]